MALNVDNGDGTVSDLVSCQIPRNYARVGGGLYDVLLLRNTDTIKAIWQIDNTVCKSILAGAGFGRGAEPLPA
jgi:hypothetical protein